MLERRIGDTEERMPVIGLGSWQTMDISASAHEFAELEKVWNLFFQLGGKCIDTSPMYGKSEQTIGSLNALHPYTDVFYATKVWTRGEQAGREQIQRSFDLLQTDKIDLFQIHNLLDTDIHLKTLRGLKEKGKIRYIGLTHFVPSAFSEMEKIAKRERIDFLQIPYSILTREAEERLLPFAEESKISILVNRPFEEGSLFQRTKGKKIPDYFKEWNCETPAQCFLKFILSHPAVTCVIPATRKISHLKENMQAGIGPFPSGKDRIVFRNKLLDLVS